MDPNQRFRLLAAMALVDGRLMPAEERVLLRAASRLGISRDDATQMVREMSRGGGVQPALPTDRAEQRELFQELVEVAVSDGEVAPQEQGCLQSMAPTFGILPGDVTRMLREGLERVQAGGGSGVSLQAPKTGRRRRKVKTGEVGCPSCGAPIAFTNTRSVARVCEYCEVTVVREDGSETLRDLGVVSHVVDESSPIQIGASGNCFGLEFHVLGRLQIEHRVGYWNEWYVEWADRKTGWLSEALGQYCLTFPSERGEVEDADVPAFERLEVGRRVVLRGKRYEVTEVRRATATGTQGETPFVVEGGYELPYADLRRSDDGFATIDYSEGRPLVFVGSCVRWRDLNMRNYRSFDGW